MRIKPSSISKNRFLQSESSSNQTNKNILNIKKAKQQLSFTKLNTLQNKQFSQRQDEIAIKSPFHLNSPDFLLPDSNLDDDLLNQIQNDDNILENDHSETNQNIDLDYFEDVVKDNKNMKNNISSSKGNIIDLRQDLNKKITQAYLDDHGQLMLRPIAKSWIKYFIIVTIFMMLIKIFWIFLEIQTLSFSEELFLKKLMKVKLHQVQNQFDKTFAFLQQINDILGVRIENYSYSSKNQTSCQAYNNKYLCSSLQTIENKTLYKIIDINYDLISIQIGLLMAQLPINNIFIFNKVENNVIQFNLSTIFIKQLARLGMNPNNLLRNSSMSHTQIKLISNYIKNYTEQNDEDLFDSYLDSQYQEKRQSFQWWQVFEYGQNQTQKTFTNYINLYNIYCLQQWMFISNNTQKLIQDQMKICINILTNQKIKRFDNKLFLKAERNKLLLTGNSLRHDTTYYNQTQQMYQQLQQLIQSSIKPLYTQYQLEKDYFLKCIRFHENFYQFYSNNSLNLKTIRCFNSNSIHLLISNYIFSWSIYQISKQPYQKIGMSVYQKQKFKLEMFIFSNSTYFQNAHTFTHEGVQNIEFILKLFFLSVIVIMISFEMSNTLIIQIVLGSFLMIKRISKLIKNTQDVKHSQNQFQKIILEVQNNEENNKTYIFDILPCYFQKFLWIKKLYFYNLKLKTIKSNKRELLLNGLKLFKYENDKVSIKKSNKKLNKNILSEEDKRVFKQNYQKYPSVLIYIYSQLIQIEQQKIVNLKNIKIITQKRQQSLKINKRNSAKNQIRILNDIDNKQDYEEKQHDSQQQYGNFFKDHNQIPPISILENKQKDNKGVRFSQIVQIKNIKKSQFRNPNHSNSSIGKKSSLKSLKSIQMENNTKKKIQESDKVSRSQQDSNAQKQYKKSQKQITIKNILLGEQSIHEGLKTMKFDQSLNHYDQRINQNQIQFGDSINDNTENSYIPEAHIITQNIQYYQNIISYYQQLIQIKRLNLQNLIIKNLIEFEEQEKLINDIYQLQVSKLKSCYKLLKIILQESLHGNVDEMSLQERGINYDYSHLSFYEENYQIQSELLQKALLYKMKICICLGKTISYKNLQQLCESQKPTIRLQSNYLFAEQLSKLEPFLNFQVISRCYECLCEYQTTIAFKRKTLELFIKTLAKSDDIFQKDIRELELIKRFYNKKHKKFYFIADMTESYDIFTPILHKIYDLMGKMDFMEIYNLGMDGNKDDMILVNQILKPKTIQAFLSLFEQLTLESEKSKEKNSSKHIHKRLAHEKDFNQILKQVQKNKTQFSSFLVVILGADQISNHSSILADDVDSSNNQRQINQILYNQINNKIQKNYYHILLLGTNLNNYQTKQGKLKKHIKNSFDLLEIDLIKKNNTEHFIELQKFIGI